MGGLQIRDSDMVLSACLNDSIAARDAGARACIGCTLRKVNDRIVHSVAEAQIALEAQSDLTLYFQVQGVYAQEEASRR